MKKFKKRFLLLLITFIPTFVFAEGSCEGFLGSPTTDGDPAFYLQIAFKVIKYAGIIICIGLSVYEFLQAIFKDDKDAFKPALKHTIKRLCYALVLFFLPDIVKIIMQVLGAYSTCGIK